MKSQLLYVACLTVVSAISFSAHAADYNRGLKKELDDIESLYPKRSKVADNSKIEITQVKTQEVQAPAPVAAQPQMIQQQTQPGAQQPIYIIQQPTTSVEAAPVKESRAEVLRKQREEVERQNESKLIERLEDERLNAEKDRMDKLAAPLVKVEPTPAPAPVAAPVAQPAPQAVVVPVQPVVVAPEQTSVAKSSDIKEEKKEEKSRLSIGGLAGIGNYPSVSNISGAYAVGGVVSMDFPERFSVEGSLLYSSYDIKNANYCYYCVPGTTLVTTLQQWNVDGAVKYKILNTRVTPVVGAALGFTRRNYSARVTWGQANDAITGSNAFDGGLLTGVDIKASESITIGAEFRYMWNISYRTDDPLAYNNYSGFGNYNNIGTPLEGLNYYIASLNVRLSL